MSASERSNSSMSNGFSNGHVLSESSSKTSKKKNNKTRQEPVVNVSDEMDFPGLPTAPVRKFVPPTAQKSTAVNGVVESSKTNKKGKAKAAKNNKKNSNFDLSNDFPELPLYQAPSAPAAPTYEEQLPDEPSYFERNVQSANLTLGNVGNQRNGMLNLGNVFDFPALG